MSSGTAGFKMVLRRGDEHLAYIERGSFVCFPLQSGFAVGIVLEVRGVSGNPQMDVVQVVEDGKQYDLDFSLAEGGTFTLGVDEVWVIDKAREEGQ